MSHQLSRRYIHMCCRVKNELEHARRHRWQQQMIGLFRACAAASRLRPLRPPGAVRFAPFMAAADWPCCCASTAQLRTACFDYRQRDDTSKPAVLYAGPCSKTRWVQDALQCIAMTPLPQRRPRYYLLRGLGHRRLPRRQQRQRRSVGAMLQKHRRGEAGTSEPFIAAAAAAAVRIAEGLAGAGAGQLEAANESLDVSAVMVPREPDLHASVLTSLGISRYTCESGAMDLSITCGHPVRCDKVWTRLTEQVVNNLLRRRGDCMQRPVVTRRGEQRQSLLFWWIGTRSLPVRQLRQRVGQCVALREQRRHVVEARRQDMAAAAAVSQVSQVPLEAVLVLSRALAGPGTAWPSATS